MLKGPLPLMGCHDGTPLAPRSVVGSRRWVGRCGDEPSAAEPSPRPTYLLRTFHTYHPPSMSIDVLGSLVGPLRKDRWHR